MTETIGHMTWPGHRAAMSFTFDVDAEEVLIVDDDAEHRPAVQSQGTYGPRVGVPQILRLLHRYDVLATFFVPGRVAERHPQTVVDILAAGHEIAHHGYTHRAPAGLTFSEEKQELEQGLQVLRHLGAEISGYRAPNWDVSVRTVGMLEEAGFAYSSNFMDDIQPYRHGGGRLIELPVSWTLDDAPHFWFSAESWQKTIRSVAEVRQLWAEESQGIAEMGGLAMWIFHPQLIGRPGRLPLLEQLLAAASSDASVWVAPARAVAAHAAHLIPQRPVGQTLDTGELNP